MKTGNTNPKEFQFSLNENWEATSSSFHSKGVAEVARTRLYGDLHSTIILINYLFMYLFIYYINYLFIFVFMLHSILAVLTETVKSGLIKKGKCPNKKNGCPKTI